MKNIDEALDGCVRPLQRDPEVALDVRRELAGHLEEHLAEGMSEAEALRRFGDPEEIGAGLFQANFKRLKLRAKIRLAVMILSVPAVIGALFFSINFRFWNSVVQLQDFALLPGEIPQPLRQIAQTIAPIFGRKERQLSGGEAVIAYGDRSRGATANLSANANAQYAIAELYPRDRVFRANAILSLLANTGMDMNNRPFRIAEVEKARAFEPGNALYDFLLAALLLEDALEFPSSDKERFQIRDRPLLDRAMTIFRTGLRKPYYRSYLREMAEKRDAVLNDGTLDFASGVTRIVRYAQIVLPHLNLYRSLARPLPFYGELLITEGNQPEGELFLDAWKPFVRKFVQDEISLIGLVVAGSIIDSQKSFARLPIPEKRQQELARAVAPVGRLRASLQHVRENAVPAFTQGAGFFSCMMLAGLPTRSQTQLEIMLEPERRLNYVFANGVMLQFLNTLGCFILCGYAVGMLISLCRGRPGFLLTFSRRDGFRIGLWGILVPLALFFSLMELTPLGGRSFGLNPSNPGAFPRLAVETFAFLFLLPVPFLILWRQACRRRGRELGFRKLPPAVWHCNMFVGWVVLLVSFTMLVRPGLCFAERYWTDREQLIIHAEFFTQVEDQLIRELRGELLKALPD